MKTFKINKLALQVGTLASAIAMCTSASAEDWQRTVVFIKGETQNGQDMFIRGGIDWNYAKNNLGINCDPSEGGSEVNCMIPIRHNLFADDASRASDLYLDWHGDHLDGIQAVEGSPLVWTTNNCSNDNIVYASDASASCNANPTHSGYGFTESNQWGDHYWLLDVEMDCDATVNGWFELKSFISNGPGWEGNVDQPDAGYQSGNHVAECGKVNVFERGNNNRIHVEDIEQGTPADTYPELPTIAYDSDFSTLYLRGTNNSFSTDTPMALVADGVWQAEATFGDAADERFKFDVHGDWSFNIGDDDANGSAGQSEEDIFITQGAGIYRVTFNEADFTYSVEKTVANLPGFTFFPANNGVTQNDSILVSGTATAGTIDSILVNGEAVETDDNFATWSLNHSLFVGDNDITIAVSANGIQYAEESVKIRYNGAIAQGTSDAEFDGINFLYLNDYRSDAIIQHNLTTGFQKRITQSTVQNLPADSTVGYLFAANNGELFITAYTEEEVVTPDYTYIDQLYSVYKLDNTTLEATLISAHQTPVSINDPRDMTVSEDSSTIYVISGNPDEIIKIDVATGERIIAGNADTHADDALFDYFSESILVESKNTMYLFGEYYDYDNDRVGAYEGFYQVALTGDDAFKFVRLPVSTAEGCLELPSYVNGFGYNEAEDKLYFGRSRELYELDLATQCVTTVTDIDEQALGLDSSLQGVAYNNATQDLYLGYYSSLVSYNLGSREFNILETRGFSTNAFLIQEPTGFAMNEATGDFYVASEEFLSVMRANGETVKIAEFADDVTGLAFDATTQRLYVSFEEDANFGFVDTSAEVLEYIELTNNTLAGTSFDDFESLVLAGDDKLFALAGDDIVSINGLTGEVTMLSENNTDGIDLWREDHIIYDEANNRIIAEDDNGDGCSNSCQRFIAIDATTGARSVLDMNFVTPEGEVVDYIYGMGFYATESKIYFSYRSVLYTYDLTNSTVENVDQTLEGENVVGDPTAMKFYNGNLFVADDDYSGIWSINLQTSERILIQ